MRGLKNRLIYLSVCSLICINSSCKKENHTSSSTVGYFRINQVKVPLDSIIARIDTATNFISGYTQRTLQIYLFSGTKQLRMFANNWSWQMPPTNGVTNKSYWTCTKDSTCNSCIYVNPDRICDGAVIEWLTTPYSYSSVGTTTGYVDVVTDDTIHKTLDIQFTSHIYTSGMTDSILVDGELNKLNYYIY